MPPLQGEDFHDHPAVELLTGRFSYPAIWCSGLTLDALKWAIFSALMIELAVTDVRRRILHPDAVNFFGLGVGLLLTSLPNLSMLAKALWFAIRWFDFPSSAARSFVHRCDFGRHRWRRILWIVSEGYFSACGDAKAWALAT